MGAIERVFRGRRGGQERPATAIVAGLWRNGEQGVWYDPSDLNTMFQDVTGTTPCYQPGQGQVDPPVGMLLDKRLGFSRGPELISNTGLASLDGWTAVRGATATASGGVVTVTTADPNNWGSVSSPITTVPGKTYLVTAYATVTNGQNVKLLVSESPTLHVNITTSGGARNAVGYYALVFKATKTTHYVWLGSSMNSAGVAVSSWTTPTAREVSPNYAYQSTATCRPTLSARYNLLTATQEFGATAWVKVDVTVGISENVAVAPNGTLTADQITLGGGMRGIRQDAAFSGSGVQSIWVKAAPSGSATHIRVSTNNASAWNTGLSKKVALTAEWQRLELAGGLNSGGVAIRVSIGTVDATGAVDTDCYGNALIWGADLRPANDGVGLPPYQRVVDANTYDTAGFPPYLKFDGVDDFLQAGSVDFSGTDKALVAAAARKLSDAAIGCLVELSSWGGVSGALSIQAPRTASNNLSAALRDATNVAQYSIDGVASPSSFVLRAMFNISATGITNQIGVTANGATPSLSVSSAGPVVASALANAPIYIGRRAGTSQPFNGRLYGLLIRGAATPDATIAKVERYLNSKARAY